MVVVAGFQGVSLDKEVTTMGRGASDLTAVALASALGADSCEIYTDVNGVFTADPRVVPNARRLAAVSYEEMLEMAATGGKVLALRSVEFARNHGVALHVRSSFTWEPGTWVRKEDQSRHGEGDHLGGHPRPDRGQGHASSACPTSRASPPACSGPWPTRR